MEFSLLFYLPFQKDKRHILPWRKNDLILVISNLPEDMEYKCDEGEDQFDTELDEGPDHLGPRHPLKRLVRCLQVSPGEERQKGGQSTVQEPTGEAQRLQHPV